MNKQPPIGSLFDFSGCTVLVTGSSQGIGRGIAERFSEAGARLALHYRSQEAAATALAEKLSKLGQPAVAFQADLSKAAEVNTLFEACEKQLGSPTVLINNAGFYPLNSLLEMRVNDWQSVLDANLKSAFLCTQAAARSMIREGLQGAIINISSIEGVNPAPLHSHYNAAKAGLNMLTQSSAQELGPFGIRVNTVSPGLIHRDGLEKDWPEGVTRYLQKVPLRRLGEADDVADACLFLASAAARWISGANLLVDGGMLTSQIF